MMATKFGGLLSTLELKENNEVHYNMNFLEFFNTISEILYLSMY
jgi:hypothetical protein